MLSDDLPRWVAWPLRLALYAFVMFILFNIAQVVVMGRAANSAAECAGAISPKKGGLDYARSMVACLKKNGGFFENLVMNQIYLTVDAMPNAPKAFVGVWDASQPRCNYRHTLKESGEFISEPRGCSLSADTFYGTWGVYENQMVWLVDEGVIWPPDINQIDVVDNDFFLLVERDGTRTKFSRVKDAPASGVKEALPQNDANAIPLPEEDTGPEATPLDTRNVSWVGMGGVPGIQQVNSIVTNGNSIYVAGLITTNISNGAGPASVAVWDGASWNQLAGENCAQVVALAIDTKGNLYAAGCINGVGSNSPGNIQKWNGKNWQLLGDGSIKGNVQALATDKKGNLYATGGSLQGKSPNGDSIYSGFVMKWDGKTWSKLGGGILKGGYEHGSAISIDSRGYVYVGGSFKSIRNTNSDNELDEEAIEAGEIEAHNIAFWDGEKWNAMGTDVGGLSYEEESNTQHTQVSSIAFDSKGTPYVASSRGIEKWDGKKWEVLDVKTSAQISKLFIDRNDFVYVGLFSTCAVEGGPSVGTEHPIQYWNGNEWKSFPFEGRNSGINPGCANGGSVDLFAQDEAGNLIVGGAFTETTAGARNIAKWNGKKWESYGRNVGVNDVVYGMAVDNAGALYVRGAFTRVDDIVVKRNQIAKWDEKSWSVLKATDDPIFNMKTDQNGSLYVATGHHTDQYNDGGISRISKWDGANWIKIAEINYLINSFIVDSQGKIYTCGYTGDESNHYGITTLHGVDMWDGKAWTRLPGKVESCPFRLGKSDELYLSTEGDSWKWKWNGAIWVRQKSHPSSDLFATEWKGNYFNITRENYNEGRNIITARNKTTGEIATLGATSIGSIGAMVASENYLYVGGSFLRFDRKASPFLARYELKPKTPN